MYISIVEERGYLPVKLIKFINRIREGGTNIEKAKRNGMKVGENLNCAPSVFIDPAHCFLISIGDNCTFASKVHILAHDASIKKHLGYTKIGKVVIGNRVFLGVGTIILPGCTVGDDVIVGAGSVVTGNIPPREVWAGNPAKKICSLEECLSKHFGKECFGKDYYLSSNLSEEKKNEIRQAVENGISYIV